MTMTDEQRERRRQRSLAWYYANRELCIARARKWQADNPERYKENDRRRSKTPERKQHSRDCWARHNENNPNGRMERNRVSRKTVDRHYAKTLLSNKSVLAYRDIPDELADAKRAEIKLKRRLKDA